MEPDFVINTVVSEQDYRRGLRNGVDKGRIIIWTSIAVFLIFKTLYELIYYGYYRISYKLCITSILFIGFCVYIIMKYLDMPRKIVQQNIDMLVMQTGSAELNSVICFYYYELINTSVKTGQATHIPYLYINKIEEYDTFITLLSRQGTAVYISKADIPNYHGFMNYIIQKCPAAKIQRRQ